MSFDLVAYEKLKSNIKEAISTLISHHDKEKKVDINALEVALDVVPIERRVQALVLLKTIELCDKLKPLTDEGRKNQATILNATAYYIHQQIKDTYKHRSPTNSSFYNSLNTALGISKDNEPSQNELKDLYGALVTFQEVHMFIEGDARKGFLAVQPFNFKGHDMMKEHIHLTKMFISLRIKILEEAQALLIKSQSQDKSKSMLGSWFAGSSATTKEQEHAESSSTAEQEKTSAPI